MYGALAVGAGAGLGLSEAVELLLATSLGMAIGDVLTVAWAGSRPVARLFERFRRTILRVMGGVFVAFRELGETLQQGGLPPEEFAGLFLEKGEQRLDVCGIAIGE